MTTQHSFETPDQAAIDRAIAEARQMRSAYIAQSVKAGLSALRAMFAPGQRTVKPV